MIKKKVKLYMAVKSKKNDKVKCLNCDIEKPKGNYYVNTNVLFKLEKFPTCKDCINDYIGDRNSSVYHDRVKQVLQLMDKPFLIEEWLKRDEMWEKYIPQISSLSQYKGLRYKDSVFVSNLCEKGGDSNTIVQNNLDINAVEEFEELVSFWGKGLDIEELEYLQNEYERLMNAYESEDSYAMQILFQEASHQRLTIKKKRENNQPVDKELKTLQDLLGSANIKPVQETGANATEQSTFGTLIKKYENEKPVPDPDPIWQDVDGIRRYFQIWFLGHLCKMLGINNEHSRMYEEELARHTVDSPTYENDESDENGEL